MSGLCKRNIMSSDLTRALRAQHKVGTMYSRGGKWSGPGAQRPAFSLVLALLLCDLNGMIQLLWASVLPIKGAIWMSSPRLHSALMFCMSRRQRMDEGPGKPSSGLLVWRDEMWTPCRLATCHNLRGLVPREPGRSAHSH